MTKDSPEDDIYPLKRAIQYGLEALRDAALIQEKHSAACFDLFGDVEMPWYEAKDQMYDCPLCSLQLAILNAEDALDLLGGWMTEEGKCPDCGESMDEHQSMDDDIDAMKPPKPKKEYLQ